MDLNILFHKSETVPKETWEITAALIRTLAQSMLEDEGTPKGEEYVELFTYHMQLAYTAVMYVSEFATNKCRIFKDTDAEGTTHAFFLGNPD